jgi:hypothetical protein
MGHGKDENKKMANLTKRAKTEDKLPPLPKYKARVIKDGTEVHFVVDAAAIAEMAVEREGEKDQNGKTVKYTKNPAVMLMGIAESVEIIQTNPEDGCDYMLEIDLVLGGGGNGVYCPITRSKLIGPVVGDAVVQEG